MIPREKTRLQKRLHGLRGKEHRFERTQIKYYLGWHERWTFEVQLGRVPRYGAIRDWGTG